MEEEENFMVMIRNDIDDFLKHTSFQNRQGFNAVLQSLLNQYNAISTGDQYGAGTSEYFFYVQPDKVQHLEKAIELTLHKEGLLKSRWTISTVQLAQKSTEYHLFNFNRSPLRKLIISQHFEIQIKLIRQHVFILYLKLKTRQVIVFLSKYLNNSCWTKSPPWTVRKSEY
jgi:hypothetical protein